ncbi:MAG TPA: prepilin-type N-terminal cleavage/methylation domain-containing protein [Rhizomicrobium sp.]|jgi:prepilin-type N-terminal cleavage/methylation domain-containing protein
MRTFGSAHSDASGMTLIETMVVLAILGLIGSLSVVQLSHSLSRYSLHEAAGVLAADLRTARAQASRSQEEVEFSANGATYGWTSHAARLLPNGVRFVSLEGDPIAFYPDGSESQSTIEIGNNQGRLVIQIDPARGIIIGPGA